MTDDTPPHLQPVDAATVDDLCDRAEKVAFVSYLVRLEIKGFRESRTPWDARRLANALAIEHSDYALVQELDRLAQERGGLSNRRTA